MKTPNFDSLPLEILQAFFKSLAERKGSEFSNSRINEIKDPNISDFREIILRNNFDNWR